MKKGTQTRRHERPRQCGPRPHPAGGAEERPPAGLPTSGALSAAETAGAAAGSAGRGRPPTPASRAPRPGKKAGPGARARSPPSRGACALHPLGPPRPPGGRTHPAGTGAGAVDRLLRGGGEDAGKPERRGQRRRARREKAGWGRSGPGRRRQRLQSLAANRVPAPACVKKGEVARAARRPPGTRGRTRVPASPRPRTRRGSGCAETPTGTRRGRGGSPCGAGGRGRGEEGAPDAPQRTTRSAPRAELRNTELAGSA